VSTKTKTRHDAIERLRSGLATALDLGDTRYTAPELLDARIVAGVRGVLAELDCLHRERAASAADLRRAADDLEGAAREIEQLRARVAELEAPTTEAEPLTAEQIAEACGLARDDEGCLTAGGVVVLWRDKGGWNWDNEVTGGEGCEYDLPTEIAALRAYAAAKGVALGAPEQPAPTGGTGDCWRELLARVGPNHPLHSEMEARRTLGLTRYGVPLGRGDGRDAERDLREELLDAAVYAQRAYGAPGDVCDLALELLEAAEKLGRCLSDLPGTYLDEEREDLRAELARRPVGWTPRELAVWRVLCAELRAEDRDLAALTIEALVGERVAE
jgi:hypothetical protein